MAWTLLSWNVAGRTRPWSDQLAAMRRLDPDVVALQEVTSYTSELWRQAFVEHGWGSFVFSFDLAPSSFLPTGPRRYGLVLASRLPLVTHDPERFPVPRQERVLSATIDVPSGSVEVTTTHVPPGSSNGWIKIKHLEGLRLGLVAGSSMPRVVCGKRGDARFPRRFDHVFANTTLRATAFTHVHELRDSGVSDHSRAFVEFAETQPAEGFRA